MVNGTPDPAATASGAVSTRNRLIEAAFRVVADQGLEAASVKVIAAAAQVTPGLVHYHFANKEAVIEAALRWSVAASTASDQARRAATQPHRQVEAFFGVLRSPPAELLDAYRFRLALVGPAMASAPLARLVTETSALIAAEVASVFANAAGRDTADDRELVLAATVQAAIDGVMLAHIADPCFPIVSAMEIIEQAAAAWVVQPRLL